ncbi:MAG: hypothetical protein GY711_23630 [bacterium]|nr:hypothetical protein [bacterium]
MLSDHEELVLEETHLSVSEPIARGGRPDERAFLQDPVGERRVSATDGERLVRLAREAMMTRKRDLYAFIHADAPVIERGPGGARRSSNGRMVVRGAAGAEALGARGPRIARPRRLVRRRPARARARRARRREVELRASLRRALRRLALLER